MSWPTNAERRDWWSNNHEAPIKTKPLSVEDCIERVTSPRWAAKIRVSDTGCHEWIGANNIGYGIIGMPGQTVARAHRVSWVAANGRDIPAGLTIDHLCRNPPCVNPAHLEAVSMRVNTERAETASTINARRTHCPAGHPLNGPDAELVAASLKRGARVCAICQRERKQTVRRAAKFLGLTEKQYGAEYGYAVAVANRILNGEKP